MKFNLSKKYIWLFVLLFILIAVVALHVLTHKTQGLEGFEDPTNNVISTTIPAMPVQATFAPTIQAAVAATMPAAASAPVSAVVPATAMTQPTQQQPVQQVQQVQQQYNAPSTFSNANLVNDSNGQANLVINEKGLFGSMTNGKPLGTTATAHEKINRVIDGLHTELKNFFAQYDDITLNTPLNQLPQPAAALLQRSLPQLFPITTTALGLPLNQLLNTNISIAQIADAMQPVR